MAATTIHLKTDTVIRDKAAKVAAEFGISLTALLNQVLDQVGRTKKVSLDLDETPSEWMIDALRKSDEDEADGRVISFKNPVAAVAYFRKRVKSNEAITRTNH